MQDNIDLSNGIEVDCFICGSNRIVKGKCLDCGYECKVEFVCPYYNNFHRCNKAKKSCKNKYNYYECPIYSSYRSKS